MSVRSYLNLFGHATNAQILKGLRNVYPNLSATTVHRITSRLLERGEIALAPDTHDQSKRFDNNLTPHDHFQCDNCDGIKDIKLPSPVFDAVQEQLKDCSISGRLVIKGTCNLCMKLR